ncbi:MAG: hypothetical protein J6X03_04555 [Bacilli bacterium]|nr:hypothetical protein [Bacilli bacterium]
MQVSAQENLDKYFQNADPSDIKKEEKTTSEVKTSEEQSHTDNLNQIKITKIELDMDGLPEAFGSSNFANFKQTTTNIFYLFMPPSKKNFGVRKKSN